MAYTAPRTWVVGEVVTAALMNQHLRDNIDFLANPPMCRIRQTVAQSIPDVTWQALTLAIEDWDTDNMHATGVDDRLTATTPGVYSVAGIVSYAGNVTGTRGAGFRKNVTSGNPTDAYVLVPTVAPATLFPGVSVVNDVRMGAGSFLQFVTYQSSGAALNTGPLASVPVFSMIWQSN